jgi:hypothetical protein
LPTGYLRFFACGTRSGCRTNSFSPSLELSARTEILCPEPLTEKDSEANFADMRRWNITWPALLVLVVAVGVIVFLLIHPDVDPPDTAFHLGTAPVVVHARTNASAALMAMSPHAKFWPAAEYSVTLSDLSHTIQPLHDSILLLDRSLRI